MSARDEILGRIRAGCAAGAGADAARRAEVQARLAAPPRGPQPKLAGDLIERFMARAAALGSSVERRPDGAALPAAVGAALSAQGLTGPLVAAPALAALDWAAAGLAPAFRAAQAADAVGLSDCYCAIAETGTLVLHSGPATPASVSLLPATHIALVPARRIVPTLEDALALVAAEGVALPRAVNLVSGPSRTGDIEQTIVLGAHGPCRVHLIIYGETS